LSEIEHAYPLILNKVASPHYATPLLRRARLVDWMNGAANCRAVVVAADAGYGKTTLLWQWEREVAFPCYWYKLDRNDRDWTFHISYLIEAIAKRHEGFGRRAHSMLQQMGGPGSSRPGVAAYLLAEMHQRLTEPCTFIIDDWQYVNAVTEVRGLWNQILRDAPPTCRFVFASRVKPRLQFARFKTHGGYAELRTDALRFTEAEIGDLFRDVYNDPLDPSELTELERRTEGWAASLQLVEVSLRERTSPDERRDFIRSITATTDSALFDFLAEEVLDQQPEETRNFLLTTSILQQITPEVAERLAGVHDGRHELSDLEQRGLFTNRLDEERYRYHNLFRDFLERRLIDERSESEVIGLHIHAASYFETTEQWPEAIHHYLRAGLQRQAARLIAKYGEDVVAHGGLGLVDEWLSQLPEESVRQNARLSLLYGEACGVRGDWERAIEALERSRSYFARKGDHRLEALACLKLSSVWINRGNAAEAAKAADAAYALLPPDATATRLRVEGNLAMARTWLTEPIEAVVLECKRIANEAISRGLDHIAAIAFHNLGAALLHAGKYEEAVTALEREATYWAEPTTHPFADSLDLVLALLAVNNPQRAREVAAEALRRTAPWPRPSAHARYGHAAVLIFDGRLREAIVELSDIVAKSTISGFGNQAVARLAEAMYLCGRPAAEIAAVASLITLQHQDDRYKSDSLSGSAIGLHVSGACNGDCQKFLDELRTDDARGWRGLVTFVRVKIGALAMEHGERRKRAQAWAAAADALELGLVPQLRLWIRRYAIPRAIEQAMRQPGGSETVIGLAELDPDGWRSALVVALGHSSAAARVAILDFLQKFPNRELSEQLRSVAGHDVAAFRGRLVQQQADRLFVRTFGRLSVHRGSWSGPQILIDKKRVRALVAALAAQSLETQSRDELIDRLWPTADGDSAINSLNQSVFQLRRYLDPQYRAGESPEYVLSSAEQVELNPLLIRIDLAEITRVAARIDGLEWNERHRAAERVLALIRGDFLAEFRYEDWATPRHHAATMRLRRLLLPIARARSDMFDPEVRIRAATALLRIDPYDEAALLALATSMAESGRRIAARNVVLAYAHRLRDELDDEPSDDLIAALSELGGKPESLQI
jgi:ATP/maltotriose-dependent transcriptional regulator MalT/DNA-binding SARP family transcriptional activator